MRLAASIKIVIVTMSAFVSLIIICGMISCAKDINNYPRLRFNNTGLGYSFVTFLNGEPVYGGNGVSIFTWKGFPLKKGENELACAFKLLPNKEKANMRFESYLLYGKRIEFHKELRVELSQNGVLQKKIQFDNDNNVELGHFDEVKKNYIKCNLEEVVKRATIKIVQAMEKRDLQRLSSLFGPGISYDFSNDFPIWFFDDDSGLVKRVNKYDDIEVLFGDYFILSKSNDSYIEKFGQSNLFSIENDRRKVTYKKNSFIFVLKQNQLHLLGKNESLRVRGIICGDP